MESDVRRRDALSVRRMRLSIGVCDHGYERVLSGVQGIREPVITQAGIVTRRAFLFGLSKGEHTVWAAPFPVTLLLSGSQKVTREKARSAILRFLRSARIATG